MNESSISQEIMGSTAEPKLFGLPRPIAGALTGFLFFSTLVLIFNIWDIESGLLRAALLAPGFLAIMFFHNLDDSFSVPFLISSFLPTIIGSLIIFRKRAIRVSGIILMVIYLLVLIPLGMIARMFMYIAGDF